MSRNPKRLYGISLKLQKVVFLHTYTIRFLLIVVSLSVLRLLSK